jgi:SNF2 family DNA or RNA helicase
MLKTRLISPYQHDGLKWLVARENVISGDHPGGFLCDEMGLGKTVQMLATMCVNVKHKTLVVVPKSIVTQWRDEIARFVPTFKTHIYDGPNRALPIWTDAPWVVIAPYSVVGMRKGQPLSPIVRDVEWDRVILDEGHEIRNKKSAIYTSCLALRSHIRWIVSGTPIFNSMKDFVALAGFVGIPSYMVQGYTEDVRKKYILRRTKQDVSEFNKRLELPPCDFENLELVMHPEERKLYEEAFSHGQEVVASVLASEARHLFQMEMLEALLRVRQVMAYPQMYLDGIAKKREEDPELWCGKSKKMETLMELIKSHPTEKTLVFCQFMGEMDRIQELTHEASIPTFRIDGGVAKDQRASRIKGFKSAKGGAVFLIQIKSGGFGLNLQEATRVYITSPAWNPATEMQAIARAHRTGQTQKVTVRKLIYAGEEALPSVEQSILELQGAKSKVCAEVLNDTRLIDQIPKTKSSVTVQNLRMIFRL